MNSYFAKNVLDRIKNAYSMPTDAELADFLGVVPSTITGWRRRNTLDFKLIFKKCEDLSADYMFYELSPMFRDPHDPRNIKKPPKTNKIKKPSEIWPDDPVLAEFERRVDEIVDTIMHGPFSRGLKIRLVESLLRMGSEELDELHKQSDSIQSVDN